MAAVGRETELRTIERFLDLADAAPHVLLLEGDAGIGKTTLWHAGVDRAKELGYVALRHAAAVSETQLAFTALRDLLDVHLDGVADDLPSPQRHALEVVLLREAPGADPPDGGAIAVAVLSTLRALAGRSRVLLAVDDAQWLDGASATVLSYAARRLGAEPVAWLVSRRVADTGGVLGLDPDDPGRVTHIELGALSVGALGRILHDRLGTTFPRPTLHRLHSASEGNPFHALELARALGTDRLPLRPGAPLPVPSALRDLVGERLAALPAETVRALSLLSALPHPSLELVDAALDGDASAALGPAAQAQIVVLEESGPRFAHPLYAEVVYQLCSSSERRQIHGSLAALAGDLEQRAGHLALSVAEPDGTVASVVEEGAAVAFARGSPASAAELTAEALRLTPAGDLVARTRRSLAEADYLFAAGDTGQADARLAELLDATAGPDRAGVLARRARIQHFGADIASSVGLLEQALAEVGDDARLRTEIDEGLAWGLLLLRRDLPRAAEHARSAAELAAERGDSRALAEGLAAEAVTAFVLGLPWEAAMARALELEPSMGEVRVLRHPSFAYGYCLSCADRLDEARSTFASLRARAEEHGDEGSMPSLLNHLTLIECLAGSWDDAASLGEDCLGRARESGQTPTQASVLGKLALLAARRGAADETRALADRALETATGGDIDARRPEGAMARGGETAVWARGSLELSLGDPEAALRWLGPLCSSLLGAGVEEPGEIRALPDAIESLVALERLDEADALVSRLEGWAERLQRPSTLAAASRCRGLVLEQNGEVDAALEAFAAATAWHDRSELPFERALALLALGALERRARRRKAAREHLQEAVDVLERLGAAGWAGRARGELGRIGGRASSPDGLHADRATRGRARCRRPIEQGGRGGARRLRPHDRVRVDVDLPEARGPLAHGARPQAGLGGLSKH